MRRYCCKCKGKGWYWEEVLEGCSLAGKPTPTQQERRGYKSNGEVFTLDTRPPIRIVPKVITKKI